MVIFHSYVKLPFIFIFHEWYLLVENSMVMIQKLQRLVVTGTMEFD